jgi:hypothetical protein
LIDYKTWIYLFLYTITAIAMNILLLKGLVRNIQSN